MELQRYSIAVTAILGYLLLIISALVLFAYSFELTFIYRPLGQSAMHPVTAKLAGLVGLSLILNGRKTRSEKIMACLVVGISTTILLEHSMNFHVTHVINLFRSTVEAEIALGFSNSVGINTALSFMSLGIGLMIMMTRYSAVNMLLGGAAIIPALGSIYGYAMNENIFYQSMSLITSIAIVLGSLAVILSAFFRIKVAQNDHTLSSVE